VGVKRIKVGEILMLAANKCNFSAIYNFCSTIRAVTRLLPAGQLSLHTPIKDSP
jgi:hypothetical protein